MRISLIFVLTIAQSCRSAYSAGADCAGDNLIFACNTTHPSSQECIRRAKFCDGKPDCPLGSDEIKYNSSIHNENDGIKCDYKKNNNNESCLLPLEYQCDHELDCHGGKDECGCPSTFYCDNGDCGLKAIFCDGDDQCADGSDEKVYKEHRSGFQCIVTKKHVTRSCVLPEVHVCDRDSECGWGTDECFCDFSGGGPRGIPLNRTYSNEKCFRCLDGSLVIPTNHVCDGIIHCKDLSDECLCEFSTRNDSQTAKLCKDVCKGPECDCKGELQCVPKAKATASKSDRKICINPDSICDDVYDCANGFDEKFCPWSDEAFTCHDESKKIMKYLLCNGVVDCPDGSDEKRCHEEKYICGLYRRMFYKNIPPADWENKTMAPRLDLTLISKKFSTDKLKVWPYYTDACDNVPRCTRMEDECDNTECPESEQPAFCKEFGDSKCPNSGSYITGIEVCDGQPTCNDTAPETSADELYCPNRFYCKDKGKNRLPIHIPIDNRCDGRQECDDQSDEMGCNVDGRITHYYCNDSGSTLFIPIEQKCDKRKDCKEGGDECDNCEKSPFSSDEKLIKSRVLIVFLWIIGIMATVGNFAIIIHQLATILRMKSGSNPVAVRNRFMVLNLAVADLLVGVYLIALGIKDATIEKYCLHDQAWRSSSTCFGLGAMAVIGTEASVLILLIMTAYRLALVYNPYQNQSMSVLLVLILFAWILAIILGVAPLSELSTNYFLSCVWFRNHRYLGYACKKKITEFTKKLITFEGPDKLFSSAVDSHFTWDSVLSAQKLLNPEYVPERYFGYYSAHGVCLPRLFPDREDDHSWGYSMFLVLLNFFAFLFIMFSYIFIYRRTTSCKLKASSSADRAVALQRKVSRIVLTDFCCWMPVCILAFIRVAGVYVSNDVYAITAIILVPINSAMNPFLYTSLLDIIWDQLAPIRKRFNQTPCGRKFQNHRKLHRGTRQETIATSSTSVRHTVNENANHNTQLPATRVDYNIAAGELNITAKEEAC